MESLNKSSYLSVEIAGRKTLIPTSNVAEVVRSGTVRTLPGLKPGFVGVTGLRGDVLGLVNISGQIRGENNFIILNLDDKQAAVVVDSVEGIINETIDLTNSGYKDRFLVSCENWQVLDVSAIQKVLAE